MELPSKLYHVTDEAGYKRIQTEGLLPRRDRAPGDPLWAYEGHHRNPDDVVFFNVDVMSAWNSNAEAYDDPVVVEIDAESIDWELMDINIDHLEHLMEDEMYMINHHDHNLGPIVKADPAHLAAASEGEGAIVFLEGAGPGTRQQLVEAAIEHGYTVMYRGSVGSGQIVGRATQADVDAAYEAWEKEHPPEDEQLSAVHASGVITGDAFEAWLGGREL